MATYSVNQVNQVYVASAYAASVTPASAKGTIGLKKDLEGNMYFQHVGAGGLVRSDLINIANIMSAKATDAADMAVTLKKVTVTLDSTVNSGAPIAGQDYILRIVFDRYVGMSDEDKYFKYGAVHAYKNMTASDFYKTLAISIAKNFSREAVKMLKISLATASTPVEVTETTAAATLTGTYTGVILEELEQDFVRGMKGPKRLFFNVEPGIVVEDKNEVIWGTVTESAGTSVPNGKEAAQFEYFFMGERGDQYRGVGFPEYVPTEYLVDPTKEYNYINIHYAYVGSNESVQKSEKDITILVPKVEGDNTLTNSIIAAINTAAGLSIATLATE